MKRIYFLILTLMFFANLCSGESINKEKSIGVYINYGLADISHSNALDNLSYHIVNAGLKAFVNDNIYLGPDFSLEYASEEYRSPLYIGSEEVRFYELGIKSGYNLEVVSNLFCEFGLSVFSTYYYKESSSMISTSTNEGYGIGSKLFAGSEYIIHKSLGIGLDLGYKWKHSIIADAYIDKMTITGAYLEFGIRYYL